MLWPYCFEIRIGLHSGLCNIDLEQDGQEGEGLMAHRLLKYHRPKGAPWAAKAKARRAVLAFDLLVLYGIDLNGRDKDGKSTLARAIEWFGVKAPELAARIVLNDGPTPCPMDEAIFSEVFNKGNPAKEMTPLIFMVGGKQTEAVRSLVEGCRAVP